MRRKYRVFIIPPVLLFLLALSYFFYAFETSNFHAVTPGEAYRSAQPSGAGLEGYVNKYHIRSILNLRGKNPGNRWYEEEISASRKLKIEHYDIALSAGREPDEREVRALIQIFKYAPRPILIHCKAGADRSGLVSAMWKVVVDREPKVEAEKQLSIWYGHIPVGKTYAMDRFFDKWRSEAN